MHKRELLWRKLEFFVKFKIAQAVFELHFFCCYIFSRMNSFFPYNIALCFLKRRRQCKITIRNNTP